MQQQDANNVQTATMEYYCTECTVNAIKIVTSGKKWAFFFKYLQLFKISCFLSFKKWCTHIQQIILYLYITFQSQFWKQKLRAFFLLSTVGSRSRSRFFCWLEPETEAGAALFKAAPAASFRQAKTKSLVLVSNMTSRALYKGKYGPKQTCINN